MNLHRTNAAATGRLFRQRCTGFPQCCASKSTVLYTDVSERWKSGFETFLFSPYFRHLHMGRSFVLFGNVARSSNAHFIVRCDRRQMLRGLYARSKRGRVCDCSSDREKPKYMRPKKIILCVDDNEQTLSVRKFLLETKGYRVIAVQSAHDALDAVENAPAAGIDLLLCDLVMPQMDGNELIRRVKEIYPAMPALMVSGSVTSYDRGMNADVFLPKGACSPVELLERIRVLMARKRGPKKAVMGMAPAPVAMAS